MPVRIRSIIKYPAKQAAPKVEPTRKVKAGCAIKYWTPREDEILKAIYETKGPDAIGERLGRTADAVTTRANDLGLRRIGA